MTSPRCPICQGQTEALYTTTFPGEPYFFQCQEDKFCFVYPQPVPEQLRELYSDAYSATQMRMTRNRGSAKGYWKKIRRYLPKAEFRFLEVGGAFGFLSKTIAERTSARVEMIEAGETACRYAREELGLKVHQEMLEDFHSDTGYDVIFAAHVIEHVMGLESFLASCVRLLKPGGRLILLTPNAESWKFEWLRRNWAWSASAEHTLFLSALSAERLLEKGHLQKHLIKPTVASYTSYPFRMAGYLSGTYKRMFGETAPAQSTFLPSASSGQSREAPAQAKTSALAKLRPLGRPLLWLEYAVLSTIDRTLDFGRKTDELMIIGTKPLNES